MTPQQLLQEHKLILYLGNGGVGKTTISAATALEASRHGKTLVMTVDPARRLADSLGVGDPGPNTVPITKTLDALMLDPKQALDDTMRNYANKIGKPKHAENIINNKYYDQLSRNFTGTHEFAAMLKLDELLEKNLYDTIIVDTAPSMHAIDFFNMSGRVVNMFDTGLPRFMLRGAALFGKIGAKVFSVFNKMLSSEFVGGISDLFGSLQPMYDIFNERAHAIDEIIKDHTHTMACLVTSPKDMNKSQQLYQAANALGIKQGYVVVNKVFPEPEFAEELMYNKEFYTIAERSLVVDQNMSQEQAAAFLCELYGAYPKAQQMAARDRYAIDTLKQRLALPLCEVPLSEKSIYDLEGLSWVAQSMFNTTHP